MRKCKENYKIKLFVLGVILIMAPWKWPFFFKCEPSIRPDCSPSPIYDNFVELLDDFNPGFEKPGY